MRAIACMGPASGWGFCGTAVKGKIVSNYRIALNGYGRIGRCVLRALYERGLNSKFQVVAINDIADRQSIEYLTRFDSTHGRFPGDVRVEGGCLHLNGDSVQVLRQSEPEAVGWGALGIDMLFECSGLYTSRSDAQRFLRAGAPKILFSQPMNTAEDADATVVYGVNHELLTGSEQILSNASCTTNCSLPILKLLTESIGIEQVIITTIHSAMNDQPVIDAYHHEDLRRTRSAFQSVIPVSTGLARGIERLLPQLAGKVQAKAMRVPTVNVSCLDITVQCSRDTSTAEVNRLFSEAAQYGPLKGLLNYTELPHASCDFNHDPHSAVVDGSQTRLCGPRMLNLLAWFDNEWGFANRMLDVASHCLQLSTTQARNNP